MSSTDSYSQSNEKSSLLRFKPSLLSIPSSLYAYQTPTPSPLLTCCNLGVRSYQSRTLRHPFGHIYHLHTLNRNLRTNSGPPCCYWRRHNPRVQLCWDCVAVFDTDAFLHDRHCLFFVLLRTGWVLLTTMDCLRWER